MQTTKRIVIIAGEESGDIHAAHLVRKLIAWDGSLKITGIGGKHMQAAGVNLVSDLARFAVTGITEVLRNLWVLRKAFKAIKLHLSEVKPDLLILVDFPGFNLRLIEFAKQELGLRILYYISPQIWAWKANRIEIIRANIDKMAVILPFEKALYQRANVPVAFVGHPLVEKIYHCSDVNETRDLLNLPKDKRLIALLPGSRRNEIEKHMPILVKTAQLVSAKEANLHFVIPIASSLKPELISAYFKQSKLTVSYVQGRVTEVAACSDCVVVASGTASLECALQETPMCIIYKGAWLSYMVAMQVIKVKFLGLCNLLKNEMIVPELLQYDCNPRELSRMVLELLRNAETRSRMIRRLKALKLSLSSQEADCSLYDLVKDALI